MFVMRHSTRLLSCRAGLVLFCIVPTVLTASWIAVRSWMGYGAAGAAEWERELTLRLGLIVRIEDVSYSRPDTARLSRLALLDQATHLPVARAETIEVIAAKGNYTLRASQLVVEADQLGQWARVWNDRVVFHSLPNSRADSLFHIRLEPCDVALHEAGQYETLRRVAGNLSAAADERKLEVEFQLHGDTAVSTPVRLSASQRRAGGNSTAAFQFDSAAAPVPCRLLKELWPGLTRLGSNCNFAGAVQMVREDKLFCTEWSGTFAPVDLDCLVSERFAHQLSGQAQLQVHRGIVKGEQLVELHGRLLAQNGAISLSLVASAQEHLGLTGIADSTNRPAAAAIPFRQLAIGFHLDGNKIALSGSADPTQPGALLANSAGHILTAPPEHAIPAVNLVRTLLPDSRFQVPATRQTDDLIRLLPLPDVGPAAAREFTHTPTRLSPTTATAEPAVRQPVLR
jgi:hypothetical protein